MSCQRIGGAPISDPAGCQALLNTCPVGDRSSRAWKAVFRLLRQELGQTISIILEADRHRCHACAWGITAENWLRRQNLIAVRQNKNVKVVSDRNGPGIELRGAILEPP